MPFCRDIDGETAFFCPFPLKKTYVGGILHAINYIKTTGIKWIRYVAAVLTA